MYLIQHIIPTKINRQRFDLFKKIHCMKRPEMCLQFVMLIAFNGPLYRSDMILFLAEIRHDSDKYEAVKKVREQRALKKFIAQKKLQLKLDGLSKAKINEELKEVRNLLEDDIRFDSYARSLAQNISRCSTELENAGIIKKHYEKVVVPVGQISIEMYRVSYYLEKEYRPVIALHG